jgi:hypothetical protein
MPIPKLKLAYFISEEYESHALSTCLRVNMEVEIHLHFAAEPTYTSWKINDFQSTFIFKLGGCIAVFGYWISDMNNCNEWKAEKATQKQIWGNYEWLVLWQQLYTNIICGMELRKF